MYTNHFGLDSCLFSIIYDYMTLYASASKLHFTKRLYRPKNETCIKIYKFLTALLFLRLDLALALYNENICCRTLHYTKKRQKI